jgi:large subunit ribosomal protein L18Ae
LREFIVIGRKLPSEKDANPSLYKMQIFASNYVIAKSRFWYFASMLPKVKTAHGENVRVKKANGEIVSCEEVSANTGLHKGSILDFNLLFPL